ncbi:hypothetical protein HK098_000147 [Nowakowskiella sp. JEL0407]|nr:hypothetical protein HK098_000147 [Nowakowskiella sp. JEL0407]
MDNRATIFLDANVTSMSISPFGDDVVFAAKRGLYILNLDNPDEQPRVINHVSRWEVIDVQWNPHHSRSNWIASTSDQTALVWNVSPSGFATKDFEHKPSESAVTSFSTQRYMLKSSTTVTSAVESKITTGIFNRKGLNSSKYVDQVLSGHQRAISDLNWSPFIHDLLATCSLDSYVHLWDLKIPDKKPSMSFCSWTGATQVKWNKHNEWMLASSHDTDLRVWDMRKGSSPLCVITAHSNKVYGIDWCGSAQDEIVTCGQDRLVKFWDIQETRVCKGTITTKSPVWRARFTPFGKGVLTMPQRNSNDLSMYAATNLTAPVHLFSGHSDVPKEFVWRNDDYQLITWSLDKTLRIWPIEMRMLEKMGHKLTSRKLEINADFNPVARSDSSSPILSPKSPRSRGITSSTVNIELSPRLDPADFAKFTLDQEIAQITQKYSNIEIEKFDPVLRTSRIVVTSSVILDKGIAIPGRSPTKSLILEVQFPESYPVRACPKFDLPQFELENRTVLLADLNKISHLMCVKSMPCLDACMRYLSTGIFDLKSDAPENLLEQHHSSDSLRLKSATLNINLSSTTNSDWSSSSISPQSILPPRLSARTYPGRLNSSYYMFEKSIHSKFVRTGFLMDSSSESSMESSENEETPSIFSVGLNEGIVNERRLTGVVGAGTQSSNNFGFGFEWRNKGEKIILADDIVGKEFSKIPFPRLCGASFSHSGRLVCFFSQLPHPSTAKFTALTLTTRNQHPVFYPHQFNSMPKSYPLFESYIKFVASTMPHSSPSLRTSNKNDPLVKSQDMSNFSSLPLSSFGSKGEISWQIEEDDEDQSDPDSGLISKSTRSRSINAELSVQAWFSEIQKSAIRFKDDTSISAILQSRNSSYPSNQKDSASSAEKTRQWVSSSVSEDYEKHSTNQRKTYRDQKYNDQRDITESIVDMISTSASSAFDSGDDSAMKEKSVIVHEIDEAKRSTANVDQLDHATIPSKNQFVHLYDCSDLLPVSPTLAGMYSLSGDPAEICKTNLKCAEKIGRNDLVLIWKLAELVVTKCAHSNEPTGKDFNSLRSKYRKMRKEKHGSTLSESPGSTGSARADWGWHPFGRYIVYNILEYLEKLRDVQSLAMMLCVFEEDHIKIPSSGQTKNRIVYQADQSTETVEKNRETNLVDEPFYIIQKFLFPPTTPNTKLSNTPQNLAINIINNIPLTDYEEVSNVRSNNFAKSDIMKVSLIHPHLREKADNIRLCYADMLLGWGLESKMQEILKYVERH